MDGRVPGNLREKRSVDYPNPSRCLNVRAAAFGTCIPMHRHAFPRLGGRAACKTCTHGGFHARALHRARHAAGAGSPRPRGPQLPPAGRQSAGRRAYGVPYVRDRAGECATTQAHNGLLLVLRGRAPPCASSFRVPTLLPHPSPRRSRSGRPSGPNRRWAYSVGTRHVLTVRAPAFTRHGGRRGGVDS